MNKSDLAILEILKTNYTNAKCALNFQSSWQLLVATILSAQCTDERVNIVTKELFLQYPDMDSYLVMDLSLLERLIRSTGFYRQKSKYIKSAALKIHEDFNDEVPNKMEQLLQIPGVARKTANVVLSVYFNINEGIAVDTHVRRLSQRLGLTRHNDPVKIEKDLMNMFEKDDWERVSTLLIHHGRKICKAKRPLCDICPLGKLCPSYKKI